MPGALLILVKRDILTSLRKNLIRVGHRAGTALGRPGGPATRHPLGRRLATPAAPPGAHDRSSAGPVARPGSLRFTTHRHACIIAPHALHVTTIMPEINPIIAQIKDLEGRAATLRGYL
jgi:hypothetical protein